MKYKRHRHKSGYEFTHVTMHAFAIGTLDIDIVRRPLSEINKTTHPDEYERRRLIDYREAKEGFKVAAMFEAPFTPGQDVLVVHYLHPDSAPEQQT